MLSSNNRDGLKAATTKAKKNKVVSDALKYSDESSTSRNLSRIFKISLLQMTA
jgi:hypothetical protein